MNIYLLYRTKVFYDENAANVIVAETEDRARQIANENCADEGWVWEDHYQVLCEVVDLSTEQLVLTSSRDG